MLDQPKTHYEFYHYLPVSDEIMQWGLYLIGGGRGVIPPKIMYPPNGHPKLYAFDYKRGRILPEFQVILITDGRGIFESEPTGKVEVKPNSLIVLYTDILHRYAPSEQTGWKERWISLNGVTAHQLMELGYLRPDKAVCWLPNPANLMALMDRLLNQIHEKPGENTILTSLHTMAVVYEVIESTGHKINAASNGNRVYDIPTEDPLINKVISIIWTQSHRKLSVKSIVKQIPTSRRTLERHFENECGRSIHEEIILCRFSRARRLLSETNLPIKTIVYLSGFNNRERMRCAFEKYCGKSPSAFRNENRLEIQ